MSVKTIERQSVSLEPGLPPVQRHVGWWVTVVAALTLLVGGIVFAIVRSPAVQEPVTVAGRSVDAREAEAARWTARAQAYAQIRAQEAEAGRLIGTAEAYRSERAGQAWADRLTGLAVYELPELFDRVQQAEADRLTGLAGAAGLTGAPRGEAARWIARGEAYRSAQAMEAWTGRLSGLAVYELPELFDRAQQAEADRLTGLAGFTGAPEAETARFLVGPEAFLSAQAMEAWTDRLTGLAVYELPELFDRAQQAEADRLTGLAVYELPELFDRVQQAEADRLTGLAGSVDR